MAVSFVAADDVYNGVIRAVRYAIMFIGIVFLATLIFEAVSGKKAHAAQYILIGLAQCVFYLLLLSITELYGFDTAFASAATATVLPARVLCRRIVPLRDSRLRCAHCARARSTARCTC